MSVSQDDALRQAVLNDLKAGKTYRAICKDRHISPKTIKRLRDGKPSEQQSKGEVAAKAFKLFGKNQKPTAVVISLKQPPELIQDLFAKYLEMEGSILISKFDVKELKSTLDSVGCPWSDVEPVKSSIKALVAVIREWNKFTATCSTCNKPVRLIDTPDGLDFVMGGVLKWQHKGQCFER